LSKQMNRISEAAGQSPDKTAFCLIPKRSTLLLAMALIILRPALGQSAGAYLSGPGAPGRFAIPVSGASTPAIDWQKESSSNAPGVVAEIPASDPAPTPQPTPSRPESNLVFEGLASYGHYKIFASASDCKLYTAGVEYDRHSWGRLLGARMDYVAEFLPVVLLHAPLTQDIWGTPTSPYKHVVPGIGFSPIGFRMLWRDHKAVKPYLLAKGGMLGFTEKVLSQRATYENFSLQSATGVNVRVNDRFDLRLGLFSDFHFSNGFIVPVNPGIDVMSANIGLSYNLRR